MQRIHAKTILRVALFVAMGLVAALAVWAVLFWINNGRIAVKTPDGTKVKSLSYCALQCTNLTTAENTDATTAPKGEYVVHVTLDNNTNYVANVTVKGFLATTTVNAKSYKFNLSAVATKGNQHIVPVGSGLLAYDSDDIPTAINTSIGLASRPLAAAAYVDSQHTLLLYGTTSRAEALTEKAVATLYNQASNVTTELGAIDDTVSSSNVQYGKDALYVLSATNRRITKISASGISYISIPTSVSYAVNGDLPILAVNGDTIAVLSGNDFASDEDSVGATNPSVVTVYSVDGFTKKGEFAVGKRNDILGLSLSPDNKSVVVIGNSDLSAYTIATGQSILNTPAVSVDSNALVWKDDNSYVYQAGVSGLYVADLKTQEAYSVIDSSLLRVDYISGVVDNKVYLTASVTGNEAGARTESNGYIVDLNSGNSTVTPDDTSITHSLPFNDTLFTIGYHYNNQKLVLDINADASAHSTAVRMISSLGYDPGDYDIVFANYSNPFEEKK